VSDDLPDAERLPKVAPATIPKKPAWRVPGPPDHWQQFGGCLLFHLCVPLLPIGAEAVASGGAPSTATLYLAASTYALSTGVSSRNILSWSLFFVLGLVYAGLFGLSKAPTAAAVLGHSSRIPVGGILLVFAVHVLERYNRHIVDREQFFSFLRRDRERDPT
jgi:hypothetical protein